MKNKKVIIYSILLTGLLILSVNSGWCTGADAANTVQQGASVMPVTAVLKKFGLAMGAVFISLAVIWFGLNMFKKLTTKSLHNSKDIYNDGLSSPKNVDEAIVFFINKNKLR